MPTFVEHALLTLNAQGHKTPPCLIFLENVTWRPCHHSFDYATEILVPTSSSVQYFNIIYRIGIECELNIDYEYPLKSTSNDIEN